MRSIGTLAFLSSKAFAAHPRLAAHWAAAVASARADMDQDKTVRTLRATVDCNGIAPARDTHRDDIRALGIEQLEELTGERP
ncbi:hypothetical protein MARPU_10235 [Marichromatium purpuratum 984]|uniref:Uncharacterized protein n=1 Tax=Marichromatium purpuratum 984 TaxID=765910 RepID=W0E459_MARPU|nr:hypothetical protein [Marichromatium purpuratum]AHF05532.1 hypothetical protein MARPU_10235 [Marichromatium purpuratum 984]